MLPLDSARAIYFLDLPLMVVLISLVYSATRYDRWDAIFWEAFRWGMRMILFLAGIVLILWGISLDESPMLLRSALTGSGIVLEVALLFIK